MTIVTAEDTVRQLKDGHGLSSDLGNKVAIYAPRLQVTATRVGKGGSGSTTWTDKLDSHHLCLNRFGVRP
jgi:hypothetical protein